MKDEDLGNLSILADDDKLGNVVLKVGNGNAAWTMSVSWKIANGIIPMVYAACQAAEDAEKKEDEK